MPVPPTSLISRLFNIFATPGEVFEEMKASPVAFTNWLVPLAILCVAAIISTIAIFSQPAVVHQMREQQDKVFEQQIAKGKMSQQQADQIRAMAEKFSSPAFLMISGIMARVIGYTVWLFMAAMGVWIFATYVFKAPCDYLKAVEITAMCCMIDVVGVVIVTLLIIAKGSVQVSLTPVLFMTHFDPSNLNHALLSLLNVTTLWYLAVLSIGLQKLGNTTYGRAAACVYGVWAIISTGLVVAGVAMQKFAAQMQTG